MASQGLPGWWGNMSGFPLGASSTSAALPGNAINSGGAGLADLGMGTEGADTFQSMLMPTASQPPATASKDPTQTNGPLHASSPLPHGLVNMTAAELGIRDDDTDLQALLMPSEAVGSLASPSSTNQHPSTHSAAAPASDSGMPVSSSDPPQPTDKGGAPLTPEELKFYGEMFNQPGGVPSISLTSPIHAGGLVSSTPLSQPTGRNTLVPMSALSAEEIRMMDLVASNTPHNPGSSGMGVSEVLAASAAPEAQGGLTKQQPAGASRHAGQDGSAHNNADNAAAQHLNGPAAAATTNKADKRPEAPSQAAAAGNEGATEGNNTSVQA